MSTALSLPQRATEVQKFLAASQADLAAACPKHLTPERMIQLAMTCFYRTPELLECDRTSLLAAVLQASSLGLDLSQAAGEAYFIPRNNRNTGTKEATFMPGYRGLAKLARQAGGIHYIQAEIVRADDQFEAWRDPDWRLIHKPSFGSKVQITHAYAVARLATGELQLTVMTRDEIEAIRGRSQSGNYGPWKSDWSEMAKKTVIRRLCKTLPFNADPQAVDLLNKAIEADNRDFEEAPDAHHAKNHDNGTGHGSGAYARPEDVKAYEAWLDATATKMNMDWLDYHSARGRVEGVKDYMTRPMLAGHLYGWARSIGLINAPAERRSSSEKYTATAWVRDNAEVVEEAMRYGREMWRKARAQLPEAAKSIEDAAADEIADVDEGYLDFELEPSAD